MSSRISTDVSKCCCCLQRLLSPWPSADKELLQDPAHEDREARAGAGSAAASQGLGCSQGLHRRARAAGRGQTGCRAQLLCLAGLRTAPGTQIVKPYAETGGPLQDQNQHPNIQPSSPRGKKVKREREQASPEQAAKRAKKAAKHKVGPESPGEAAVPLLQTLKSVGKDSAGSPSAAFGRCEPRCRLSDRVCCSCQGCRQGKGQARTRGASR